MANKKTRLAAGASLATVAALLFAGCGTTTPEAAPTVEPPVGVETPGGEAEVEEVDQCLGVTGTVNFRWWGGDTRAELQNQALEVFHDKYPGITVNPQPMAFSGYWDQLQVEAVAGNTPDLFNANEAWLASLIGGGVFADLNTIPTVDLSHFSEDALGAAVGPNGQVYAMPTGGNAAAVLVNYDILEEAGIPVPNDETWSWEDFKNIATQVSEAGLTNENGDSVFGVSTIGGNLGSRVWANQTDGGMWTPDGELNWSQEGMQQYFQFLHDLIESGAAPNASIQQEFGTLGPGETLMAMNRAAFQTQWSNQIAAVADNTGGANIGLMRNPGDHTGDHMGTWLNPSMFFGIASNAQDPEAAGCLLNFMLNAPEAAEIMGIDRGVPFNAEMLAVVEPNLTGLAAVQAEFMQRISNDAAASIPMPELNDDINNILIVPEERVRFAQDTPATAAAALHAALMAAPVR